MNWTHALYIIFAFIHFSCQSSSLTSAKLYLQQDKPQEAKAQLLETLTQEAENVEAHFLLGKIYGEEGAYKKMVDAFGFATKSNTTNFMEDIEQIREFYWVREYNTGIRHAQPDTLNLDKALHGFANATIIDPTRLDAWKNLAYIYYQLERPDDALMTYEYIKDHWPKDPNSLYSLGVLYLNKEEYEAAVSTLNALTTIAPNHFSGHINLAIAQVNLKDFSKAENSYKKAIAIDPNAANAQYNLGNLYWQQQNYAAALQAYNNAIELAPDDNDTLYNLAITHIALEDLEAALPLLERLSQRTPNKASVWSELGRIYAIQGQIDKSKAAYEREQMLLP